MARILLIDDEPLLRDNLSAYLEDEGHEVITSPTAESGLSKLRQYHPDIVIVDLRLQGINGETFVKTAYRINSALQFIIHTGSADYELSDELRALGLGRDNIVYKPVADLSRLDQLIHQMTSARPIALPR